MTFRVSEHKVRGGGKGGQEKPRKISSIQRSGTWQQVGGKLKRPSLKREKKRLMEIWVKDGYLAL